MEIQSSGVEEPVTVNSVGYVPDMSGEEVVEVVPTPQMDARRELITTVLLLLMGVAW